LIADNLSPFVNNVFANPSQWPSAVIWLATLAFSAQIYCDFSGYSDIAIGVAKLLGYDLPLNFNRPYFARNPSDFWRRWHITLSSWLRDYLYIPLGGSKNGTMATYRNLFLTMLLGGLWHGASWNFVVWGSWHGLLLIIHRVYRDRLPSADRPSGPVRNLAALLCMQYCVLVSWIMFRVTDFSKMVVALRKFVFFDFDFALGAMGLARLSVFGTVCILLAFAAVHSFAYRNNGIDSALEKLSFRWVGATYAVLGLAFFLLWPLSESPFIYFQF